MRIRDWDRNLKVRLFGEALINITFWMFFPFMAIYFTEADDGVVCLWSRGGVFLFCAC
jgi:hypothetical protein